METAAKPDDLGKEASLGPQPTITSTASGNITPAADPVFLAASVPQSVARGERFVARLAAYLREQEGALRKVLEGLSPQSQPLMGLRKCRWTRGTKVLVKLEGKHLAVEPPEQEFVWEGDYVLLDFEAAVLADAAGSTTLKFSLVVDGFLIGSLHVDTLIGAPSAKPRFVETRAAESAFASYSSKDRSRVLDRVDSIQTRTGIHVFVDCLDIHPNEEWRKRIAGMIPVSDLFLLFWSQAAKESPYVSWELQTAISTRGKGAIEVHALEPNGICALLCCYPIRNNRVMANADSRRQSTQHLP